MGFPERISFEQLGGAREPAGPITHPKKQVGHVAFNETHWQVAGMNKVCELVSLVVGADGSRVSGGEAWNMKDEPSKRVHIAHDNTGEYVISAQATEYPDWSDTPKAVVFRGAIITPSSATSVRSPTYVLDSATQITVYTWNAAGAPADMAFTIDIK